MNKDIVREEEKRVVSKDNVDDNLTINTILGEHVFMQCSGHNSDDAEEPLLRHKLTLTPSNHHQDDLKQQQKHQLQQPISIRGIEYCYEEEHAVIKIDWNPFYDLNPLQRATRYLFYGIGFFLCLLWNLTRIIDIYNHEFLHFDYYFPYQKNTAASAPTQDTETATQLESLARCMSATFWPIRFGITYLFADKIYTTFFRKDRITIIVPTDDSAIKTIHTNVSNTTTDTNTDTNNNDNTTNAPPQQQRALQSTLRVKASTMTAIDKYHNNEDVNVNANNDDKDIINSSEAGKKLKFVSDLECHVISVEPRKKPMNYAQICFRAIFGCWNDKNTNPDRLFRIVGVRPSDSTKTTKHISQGDDDEEEEEDGVYDDDVDITIQHKKENPVIVQSHNAETMIFIAQLITDFVNKNKSKRGYDNNDATMMMMNKMKKEVV
mmetsp:Transcript_16647/g.24138  ORF Transcript_16647/g.24138 Transcript_16647/m.24138 type:complete len:435 (-) Transcript_16647:136-1440(-)